MDKPDNTDESCKCLCRLEGVLKSQPSPCSGSLIDLGKKLGGQIQDEKDATKMYAEFAEVLRKLDMPAWAATLDSMSRDEHTHKKNLETIVSVIAENCGQ